MHRTMALLLVLTACGDDASKDSGPATTTSTAPQTTPTDLAIGRCQNWGTDEDRVYYACNKFDSILPQGFDVACAEFGGTWVPM